MTKRVHVATKTVSDRDSFTETNLQSGVHFQTEVHFFQTETHFHSCVFRHSDAVSVTDARSDCGTFTDKYSEISTCSIEPEKI